VAGFILVGFEVMLPSACSFINLFLFILFIYKAARSLQHYLKTFEQYSAAGC
jgi:hypothetical protein